MGKSVRTYIVNLDNDPSNRWNDILTEHDEALSKYNAFLDTQTHDLFGTPLATYLSKYLGCIISNIIGKFVSKWIMPCFFWLLSLFSFLFSKEYVSEIRGISNYTRRFGLTFSKIFTLNIGYDILCHCTSSAIIDPEGKVWHLRNMDWSGDVLRDLSINVDFVQNGKKLYTGTTFLCTVGLLTGMNYHEKDPFSVSLNYRKIGTGKLGLWNYLRGTIPVGFQIRDCLSLPGENAVTTLERNIMISPCYLVLVRAHEGYLLTRGSHHCATTYLSEHSAPLIQTNIDHDVNEINKDWAADDPLLLNAIDRRECNMFALNKISGYTVDEFLKVLQVDPVFNSDTVYSCIMCPAACVYNTIVYQ